MARRWAHRLVQACQGIASLAFAYSAGILAMVQTEEAQRARFEIWVEQGPARGDLFELEQKTYFCVVDAATHQVLLTFEGLMEASLSRDTGLWDDYCFSGVREVDLTADGQSVTVQYCDGRAEIVAIPTPPLPPSRPANEPPESDTTDPHAIAL